MNYPLNNRSTRAHIQQINNYLSHLLEYQTSENENKLHEFEKIILPYDAVIHVLFELLIRAPN